MKYLAVYLAVLELSLTLPVVAQTSRLIGDRCDSISSKPSLNEWYKKLSLGYPTPITDQFGATSRTPNNQEWYNSLMQQIRPQTASQRVISPPENLPVPEPESVPSPGTGDTGGFSPPDRGAPESTGGAGARLKPASPINLTPWR